MNIGSVIAQFKANLSDFKAGLSDAKSDLRSAANDMSQGMQNLGGAIQGVGQKMTLFATTPIVGFGLAAVKSAAEMEQLEVAFTTMLGSAEKARKMLAELTDFAAKTPFQLGDVQEAAKSLLAYGIQADKITPTLRAIGDVAAGTNTPIKEMASLFGKMSSSGIIFTEDLNQLTDRGIPVLNVLAEKFDTNVVGVRKLASEGKISFNDINDVMIKLSSEGGQFFNLMNEQSKKTSGQFSNLQDSVSQLSREIGRELLPYAMKVIQFLQKMVEAFRGLSPETKKWVLIAVGVVAVLGPILIVIGSLISAIGAIIPAIVALGGVLAGISLPGLLIIGVIGALIYAGYQLWKNWDTVTSKAQSFIGALQDFGQRFADVVNGIVDLVVFGDFTGKMGRALGIDEDSPIIANFLNFRQGLMDGWRKTVDIIQGFLDLIIKGDFTGSFGRALGVDEDSPIIIGMLNLRDAIINGWNAIVGAFQSAYEFIAITLDSIFQIMTWIYSNVFEPILMLISAIVFRVFYEVWNFLVNVIFIPLYNFIVERFTMIYNFYVGILTKLMNLFIEIFTFIFENVIKPIAEKVASFLGAIWTTILGYTSSVWGAIKGVITAMFTAAKDSVMNTGGTLFSGIRDTWNNIVNFFRNLAGSIVDAITKPFRDAKAKVEEIAAQIKAAAQQISPFHHNSPSLVEQVQKGVGMIEDYYSSLSSMTFPSVGHMIAGQAGNSVVVNLSGANFGSPDVAEEYAEIIGDAIIRKLSTQIPQ